MVKALSDIPITDDIFIDSNVLIHIHGIPLSCASNHFLKQTAYNNAVGTLLSAGSKPITTWLNVAETLNTHERHMREIYDKNLSLKAYRRIPTERARVQTECARILSEIKAYYTVIPAIPSEPLINQFVTTYTSYTYDSTDFLAVETVLSCGITNVITDDKDFHNDTRLTTYTY